MRERIENFSYKCPDFSEKADEYKLWIDADKTSPDEIAEQIANNDACILPFKTCLERKELASYQ